MIYNTGSVVIVPFPFTDKQAHKKRPAIVISTPSYQEKTNHVVLMMITSAEQSAWYFDLPLNDLASAGLTKPCIIRPKIFTLDEQLILGQKGYLSQKDWQALVKQTTSILPLYQASTTKQNESVI